MSEGNKFTKKYYELLDDNNAFIIEEYDNRDVYKLNSTEEVLSLCYEIATEKSKETMDVDQYGKKRKDIEKVEKQFEGCLSEFATAKFLVDFCGIPANEIYVYDALRETFKYNSKEEYDVGILKNDYIYDFGIKNSKSYKTTLSEFIHRYHLIVDYINNYKSYERSAPFHIRPVIQYNDEKHITRPNKSYIPLRDGTAQLYLVGAATKKIISNKGYLKNSKNNTTKYKVVDIKDTYTMGNFAELLNEFYNK